MNLAAKHKSSRDSYGRLYVTKPPAESNKGKKRDERGEEQPKRPGCRRYTDEVRGCHGFLGIALGRRELLQFRTCLLNHAEDYVQARYSQMASVARQSSDPSTGVSQPPQRCSDFLLVLYTASNLHQLQDAPSTRLGLRATPSCGGGQAGSRWREQGGRRRE